MSNISLLKKHYVSSHEISELLDMSVETSNKLSLYALNVWLKIETEGKFHIVVRPESKKIEKYLKM